MSADFKRYDVKDLVAFTFSGFPLARQKDAFIELIKRMAIDQHDISAVSALVSTNDHDRSVIKDKLTDMAKKKNKVIKEALDYLN